MYVPTYSQTYVLLMQCGMSPTFTWAMLMHDFNICKHSPRESIVQNFAWTSKYTFYLIPHSAIFHFPYISVSMKLRIAFTNLRVLWWVLHFHRISYLKNLMTKIIFTGFVTMWRRWNSFECNSRSICSNNSWALLWYFANEGTTWIYCVEQC